MAINPNLAQISDNLLEFGLYQPDYARNLYHYGKSVLASLSDIEPAVAFSCGGAENVCQLVLQAAFEARTPLISPEL